MATNQNSINRWCQVVGGTVWRYGLSRNLPGHGPKWKSANYRLESRDDEVGVIKRSGWEYKEDQYRFWN